jgi:hypothetical protein
LECCKKQGQTARRARAGAEPDAAATDEKIRNSKHETRNKFKFSKTRKFSKHVAREGRPFRILNLML